MPSAEDTADERPPGRFGPVEGRGRSQPTVATADDPDVVAPVPGDDQARIGFIGKRLGRFLISAELGRGGMATVYRARDPHLGRDVAVKVMHGFFAGRVEVEARFRREANAVAAIRHPSILAVYEFAPPVGEEPGYIVSELIDGPSLRLLTEQGGGRLTPEGAALITIRVAEALGAAHAAGIVHRDVKPDNVLIDRSHGGATAPNSRDAGHGARVLLTDFGVAHVSGMDTMTATGAVLGSPAYMSPEQARGEDVGPPSDVFALGVLMYQLCTGRLPFAGKDPLAVISAILRGDYVRPGKLDSRIGPEWESVITRCMARQPEARFQDGREVGQALRGLLASAGIADEQAALALYLANPQGFTEETSRDIAARALVAAEQARRRRQIPRALAEVGRALAYAPDEPAARAMLARLGSAERSLWVRVGVTGTAVAALITAVVMARAGRAPGPGPTTAANNTLKPGIVAGAIAGPGLNTAQLSNAAGSRPGAAAGAELGSANSPRPAKPLAAGIIAIRTAGVDDVAAGVESGGMQTVGAVGGGPRVEAGSRRRNRRAETPQGGSIHRRRDSANDLSARLTVGSSRQNDGVDTVDPQPTVGAATASEPAPAPAAAPADPPVLARTASVVLRASHGFCEPSLDAHPPSLRASYNDLAAGPHEIFCTLPQGGGKVHVATYQLRPGTRPSLTIVPGPSGRPVLGRPE